MKCKPSIWISSPFAWMSMLVFGSLLSGVISCRSASLSTATLPQQWNENNGPVMPHGSFPSDCKLCHESGSWHKIRKDFHFDHGLETGVPLIGAHQDAQCIRCHNDRGAVAKFANKGCIGCHLDTHRGQLGNNCQDCHNMNDWTPKNQIALHNRTRFPLVGVHAGVACRRCHEGSDVGNFLRAPTRCAFCHQDDLARAVNPDHKNLGWVENCNQCHLPTDWHAAAFNHTLFPLTGVHATTDCSACHKNHVFRGLSQDCFSCHANDYQATTTPNHAGAGFSTDCANCHTTFGWKGAHINHSKFPLTGAHAAVDCAKCHKNNVYGGLSHDCFSCHAQDYQTTINPNHVSANFPTTCQTCHNTTSWSGASFNHSFRITSGPHKQYNCTECHQIPNNFIVASCTHCHEHRQSKADDKHQGVSGYSWSSPACISCHPTGK